MIALLTLPIYCYSFFVSFYSFCPSVLTVLTALLIPTKKYLLIPAYLTPAPNASILRKPSLLRPILKQELQDPYQLLL